MGIVFFCSLLYFADCRHALYMIACTYILALATHCSGRWIWEVLWEVFKDRQAFGLATFASYYYYIGYRRSLGYERQATSGELDMMMTTNRLVLLRPDD